MTAAHAHERRRPRRSRNSTAGLRPAARNSETTTSISTEPMPVIATNRNHAVSAPSAPTNPR